MITIPTEALGNFPTPFYLYDLDLLRSTLSQCSREAARYDYKVHYALKANSNPRILKEIITVGFGADCVSGNEVKHAAQYGFDPKHIVFAGVGKTDKEILQAFEVGIGRFNVESVAELEVLNQLAAANNRMVTVNIRINPNVQSFTHANITTGLNENKFGVSVDDIKPIIALSKELSNIHLGGLHFHIGSQITRMEAYKNLCLRCNQINDQCIQYGWKPDVLNLGGGLGVDYVNPKANPVPDFENFFATIHELLEPKSGQEVHFELGRSLVGQCGTLMSRVVYVKQGKSKDFVILDAGMTELMRPALYQAQHAIENLSNQEKQTQTYDVVGPICESTDSFAKALELPISKRGDMFAIYTAGAYGESMANRYNLKELEASRYVENKRVLE